MTAVLPPRTVATYDPDVVRQWLSTLHARSGGHVWIGSDHDKFRGRTFPTTNPRWIEHAGRYIDHLDQAGARGIYCRTTTLNAAPREGRGGDDDSLYLPGLAADLDIAGPGHRTTKPLPATPTEARRIIDESGLLAPSLWVHSGGGLYPWWLLDTPHRIDDLPRIKRLSARWQDPIAHAATQLGYHFGRLGDLARILRIPGTVNRKAAMPTPALCRIVDDNGLRYTLEDLRSCLLDTLAAMPKPEPVRLPARPVRRDNDGLLPWDDFEARTDWADILLPHGWTLHHTQGRVRYWTRPGKDPRDTPSATTGRAADRDRFYPFTDATDFEARTPYTKPAVYAVLNHGGNFSAAGRELRRLGYGNVNRGRAAA